jgi:uncharacterized glyoxalase superfamily protein PhnB
MMRLCPEVFMNGSPLIPCLRYRDAVKAIDWLCAAFGFERHLVVGEAGVVHHAQLSLGNSMLMLGSVIDSEYGKLMRQPDEAGGNTQSIYLVVADADAAYAKAKQAGARIATEIRDEDYGGRGFSCFDPEGHLWNVGSYDPWNEG